LIDSDLFFGFFIFAAPNHQERAQQIATAANLFPYFIMNSATLVITVQQYPEHNVIMVQTVLQVFPTNSKKDALINIFFLQISSLMEFVFNIIEIVLLILVAVIGKKFL
jgi:hypothetical protein